MESENLTALNDQELSQKINKLKANKIIDAFFVGITIGIVIYSVVKNGFDFFTLFPLILAYIIARNSSNNKILVLEMQKELRSRELK